MSFLSIESLAQFRIYKEGECVCLHWWKEKHDKDLQEMGITRYNG